MAELALALGGGGVKGFAHIGVLNVLEREGIHIGAIAGTSAGGIIGSLYCAGYPPAEIERIVNQLNTPGFFHRSAFDGPSLMGMQGGVKILTDYLGDRRFEDLATPFACTAVDLNTSEELILAHGSIVEAVLATIAVPGIFPPRQINDYLLVDGGVLDPVPVGLARWLLPSSPVIAVCLSPARETWAHLPDFHVPAASSIPRPILEQIARLRVGQAFQIFLNSIDTTSRMLAELRMQIDKPEVIIRPKVESYGFLDAVNVQEMIALGEAAAQAALPQIQQALTWANQITRYFKHPPAPGKVLEETSGETNVPQVSK
jgi:NTE family protein